jgi:hypothetical protein
MSEKIPVRNYYPKCLFCLILILLCFFSAASAKNLVVSERVSLSDTPENKTIIEKEVVADLSRAPSTLIERVLQRQTLGGKELNEYSPPGETFSESPVSDAISSLSPSDASMYKAEYISRYADVVGKHRVVIDDNIIDMDIQDVSYDGGKGVLVLKLTGSVNGVSRQVINPYKIYNPPILVQTEPQAIASIENGRQMLAPVVTTESVDNAVIISIANTITGLPEGDATFDTGDPTMIVYPDVVEGNPDGFETFLTGSSWANSWGSTVTSTGDGIGFGAFSQFSVYSSTCSACGGAPNGIVMTLFRAPLMFNTSPLTTNVTVNSASAFLSTGGAWNDTGSNPGLSLVMFTPTTNGSSVVGDFQRNKTGSFRFGPDLPYSTISHIGTYEFPFSVTGISQISQTKYTNMQIRLSNDTDSLAPASTVGAAVSGFNVYDPAAGAFSPYLRIVYSLPAPPGAPPASTSPGGLFDISYYNTTDHSLWPLMSMNATKGELISFNATNAVASEWAWDFGDGFGGSGRNVTHRYTFGKGISLMLTNGWTRVTTKLNSTSGMSITRDAAVINLTTAMEDINFVGPTETIALLNESYANTFITVIGGNRSAPAGWVGIDWLGGLNGVQDVYVSVLGLTIFYLFIFSLPFIMQWIISKDFVVAGVLGSFLGLWIITRLPASMKMVAVLFIAMSVVAIIYSLLKER